jgi:predicted dehydrogenase
MNRRAFLGSAGAAAMAPSDSIAVGLIGCGGRGRYVAKFMRDAGGVQFAAVCDVYGENRNRAAAWSGASVLEYTDYRRMLERKDLDAVIVATPDHWHAAPTIAACRAGKHVYVEKPLAWSVREGRAMVDAARGSKAVVQVGTQHRSAPHFAELARLVRSGALGKITFVRVWNYIDMFPRGIGRTPDGPPPADLDWDFWLGPAPKVPYNPLRFRAFRFFRDYAGGLITDFGTHRFDTVHQIMGADTPRSVAAVGGRLALEDAGDVPDTMQVQYEYPGWILSYECSLTNGHGVGGRTPGLRYYNAKGEDDRPHGMAFYGTRGTLFADRIGYDLYAPERKFGNTTDATALHARNFVEAIRNGRPSPAPIEDGHRATLIGHLGNIALATGRKLRWDGASEQFVNDAEANALLSRRANSGIS